MRIILSFIAFAVCTIFGMKKSRELKKRVEFLDEIIMMLNNFSVEIKFGNPELSELISRENGCFAKKVNEYLEELSDIKTAWEKACGELPEKSKAAALLKELLPALSKSGSEGAIMTVSLYSERFARLEKQAAEEYSRKGKALKQIGALCGAAAAILIV